MVCTFGHAFIVDRGQDGGGDGVNEILLKLSILFTRRGTYKFRLTLILFQIPG